MESGDRMGRAEAGLIGTAAFLVFTRVFGMSVVLPGFATFGETFTDRALLIGVAMGAYGITLALLQLPMGLLSDRIGRRPVLLLGSLLFAAGSLWAALAPDIGQLIAARLLQGTGAVSSVAMAMVGESVPAKRRTTAMALVGIPAGGGFLLGMVAGPLLEPLTGMRGLFLVVAGMGLLATLPVLRLSPGRAQAPIGRIGQVTPAVTGLAFAGFTANFALLSVMVFLADTPQGWLVPLLLVALVIMALASRLSDKRAWTWQPAAVCLPILGLGATGFVLGAGAWAILGGAAFFSAHATLSAVLPSQVSRIAGRAGGRGHGIQNIVAYPGSFVGSTLAGAAIDAGHPEMPFLVLGGLVVVAAIVLAFTVGRNASDQRRDEDPDDAAEPASGA